MLGRFAQQRDLARALDHPHLVEDVVEVLELDAGSLRRELRPEPRLARRPLVPRIRLARPRVRAARGPACPSGPSRRGRSCRPSGPPEPAAALSKSAARQHVLDPRQLFGGGAGHEQRSFRALHLLVRRIQVERRALRAAVHDQDGPRRRRRRSGSRTGCSAGTSRTPRSRWPPASRRPPSPIFWKTFARRAANSSFGSDVEKSGGPSTCSGGCADTVAKITASEQRAMSAGRHCAS